jgi:DNA-3-methyladenine glycosylase I
VPERDNCALYEKLVLDGFQAGLSWITILRKRENFRAAFKGFEPEKIARWGEHDVVRLLADPGIIRHRGKIEGAVANARAYLAIQEEGQSFSDYLWGFVDGRTINNRLAPGTKIPATSAESAALSKDLKARGFKFCGPTIVYAFMQAVGMVNDHHTDCFRHAAIAKLAKPSRRKA